MTTTTYDVKQLLAVGLVFHCIFIMAVFDTYFTSPVVGGMQSYSLVRPEARRLVLIVGALLVKCPSTS